MMLSAIVASLIERFSDPATWIFGVLPLVVAMIWDRVSPNGMWHTWVLGPDKSPYWDEQGYRIYRRRS